MASNGTNSTDQLTREAWLVGGGIASLAAAVHLIHDARVAPDRIHILEAENTAGGNMAAETRVSDQKGYIVRAARKLNFTYHCLHDTLSRIAVISDDSQDVSTTLLDRIRQSQPKAGDRGRTEARLVASTGTGPEIADSSTMGLCPRNQADLMALMLQSEDSLGEGTIRSFFDDISFFETNFWDMFSTMYMFKPWHSAVEFRRYLHRFLHEFPNISTLAGVEYMPTNDFEATIVPMVKYLEEKGVEFRHHRFWY
jgi:oleate hydratase